MMQWHRSWFAPAMAALLLVAGCTQREPTVAATQPAPAEASFEGQYRAVLQLPAGELPFGLEIGVHAGRSVAWLINGAERLQVDDVTIAGEQVEMTMPGYQNRLVATRDKDGLRGSITLVKLKGEKHVIPFIATRGARYRFFAQQGAAATVPADVAGRWATTFTDDSGQSYPAVGEFTQQGDQVNGTFLTPTGDYRYLAGNLKGNELFLSTFDGAHAFLFRATLDAKGALSGDYFSGLTYHEKFTARRDDKASLGKAESATTLKAGRDRLDFSFPDVNDKPVSLHDERFKGKVVVVTLAGSWCPNCHDEAAFLAPYYIANRERGLEIVALMFEQFGDFASAAEAVKLFQKQSDIRYPMLIAGIHDTDDAASKLPQLNKVYAFPTTLFIDRRGKVRRIHTGFSGPATGEHYARLKQDFEATISQLLGEKA
jgi:peroxiredoxin